MQRPLMGVSLNPLGGGAAGFSRLWRLVIIQ